MDSPSQFIPGGGGGVALQAQHAATNDAGFNHLPSVPADVKARGRGGVLGLCAPTACATRECLSDGGRDAHERRDCM